ncbi:nucleotide exchange factor GrpE [Anaeromyxobacter sp. Fw109-5]|uniref:nucleotide exchange factor GrpE n=1 Tax=Anaeromyxobacter sp. (strain Fw109-5) TaxID=404589 RepID=UPI000158A805|nr:nucleotide exchange factor GrpE [Anaeromyxobacter sp. Fw109-5]ABS28653.1 GrpE protein [Anaeromyxobacter sp. Fw109-5]
MADSQDKGAFRAEIPLDAVEEALRSVERISRGAAAREEASSEVELEGEPAAPADAAEVAQLRAQLELSQAKGREVLEKLREEHERLLRAAADLENFKKRAAREREEVQRFGNEQVVKDLLPVVDGLDRALAAAPAGDAVADGVRLVRASLEQALAKHGVSAFSAMGARFDPVAHEALLQVPTDAQPPGTVVLEHARGFKLHGRLVRPAMVGVAVAAGPDRRSEG